MAEDGHAMRAATSTALNAVQALGRGFDVTCDIRLLYCKGTAGSRLIEIDEEHTKDLVLKEGLIIPDVSRDIKSEEGKGNRDRTGVYDFEQMSERFNRALAIPGKTPLGLFNAMFSFSGSWQIDASTTKGLALDGLFITLYHVKLARSSLVLRDEIKRAVPISWDPAALASFIERYGTHIIVSVGVGGKDAIYVKQHQSSTRTPTEIEMDLKELADHRFSAAGRHPDSDSNRRVKDQTLFTTQQIGPQPSGADGSTSLTGKEDITVIYRRRGGDDLVQDHNKWRATVFSNPDVILMSFVSIVSLLEAGPGKDYLSRAIDVYLQYKPPIEELRYFLEFQVPRAWAPVPTAVGIPKKEPVCPSLQFSLMGPKLYISTIQVSVGRKPVTGLRLCLEGNKCNRLAIHVQHLTTLPKILQPHWDAYVAIGAPKWHGPEEQDSRWFEPVQWKNFSHVSTAPVEFSESWIGDLSGAFIVTGAQLGVWDFGLKSVLYLRLLYSKVPGCTIRRSVWDHSPAPLNQQFKLKSTLKHSGVPSSDSPGTSENYKLSKFVDAVEMMKGPQDTPGHWLVTGAKLGVEKSKIFLRVKYSLLNY